MRMDVGVRVVDAGSADSGVVDGWQERWCRCRTGAMV
jgi:hypothetical protein